MPRRTVRRVAAAVLAAPMLVLAVPAVASANHTDGFGSGAFWSYNESMAGFGGASNLNIVSQAGFGGHGGHFGGYDGYYGGALFSQSGNFAGPSGAASFDVFSFAR